MHTPSNPELTQSTLGKKTDYDTEYNPDRLFPVARAGKRAEIGIHAPELPFVGVDRWTHYEVSWLDPLGKPCVAIAEIEYDCTSPNIIESKSMKLYFNSFNQTGFSSLDAVRDCIIADLSQRVGAAVHVQLHAIEDFTQLIANPPGQCIDQQTVRCTAYTPDPTVLATGQSHADETLYSNLLKSNCLITGQPDWATLVIAYKGKTILPDALLRYIVSFRNHNEFHEQCVERIFIDILHHCKPSSLTVYARYTRRGGVDINPYRSTELLPNHRQSDRLPRQ